MAQIVTIHGLKFKLKYPAYAHILSGKTHEQIVHSIFDSLRSANIHITRSSRRRFNLRKISIFLVDLEKAKIEKQSLIQMPLQNTKGLIAKPNLKQREIIEEAILETGKDAINLVGLSATEIENLENSTKDLDWFEANMKTAEYLAKKLEGRIK